MKGSRDSADRLINTWVECLLQCPDQLLSLPLNKDFKSPWGINVMSGFLVKEISITISEAQRLKHLTLPLIKKLDEMQVIKKEASIKENFIRQEIFHWYNSLSFNDKNNLPRLTSSVNNICFESLGSEQSYWANSANRYEWVAKVIDGIHEDLFELGIIGADFKKVNGEKQIIKDVRSTIVEWVSRTVNDLEELWEIPISKADNSLGFSVSVKHIQNITGASPSRATLYREFTNPLIKKMIEKDILVVPHDSYKVAGIENRRKLLNWYRQLSEEEKYTLPIFGNKISLNKMHFRQRPINSSSLKFNIVKNAWDFIHKDLEKLNIVDVNYKSFAERKRKKNFSKKEPSVIKKECLDKLAMKGLNTIADFIEPSNLEPFIQIEQLFAAQIKTVASESSKGGYRSACSLFIKYLSKFYGSKPLRVIEVFDEHLLSRYRKYLHQKIINKKISSHSANTVLGLVRRALHRLTQVRDSEYIFFDVSGFSASRETDTKKPFTKNERLQILDSIEKGLNESRKNFTPYKITGIGINPLSEEGFIVRGLSTLENARWLFENHLMCRSVHYNTANSHIEKAFLRIIASSDKSLKDVYEEWGVSTLINVDTLIPYILRLAQVTGLNTDSLLSLDIDDYVDCHPATLRPCLRYWKERSNGHKEYHLDLFNADLTWLTSTQAKSIKIIFEEVISLTKDFRHLIEDDESKNKLFIYQSKYRNHRRVISLLEHKGNKTTGLGYYLSKFTKKYNLHDDSGYPITLNISRFRPTFVSEMLSNGVSLREVQLMLGHSSIQMTINYLDSFDFNSVSRTKINDKLKEIHQSTLDEKTEELSKDIKHKISGELAITFHTPLAECRNIFDPPDFVKNLSSYIPGTPCSQYNKCLGCDNVIITAKNLPEIFAMKRDYTLLTEHTRVMDTPYGHVISENIELIRGIIDPELSAFSSEELENGRRLAEYIETTTLIDGAV